MSKGVSAREFHESGGVEDWRAVGDGASAFFRTGSLAAGARFVERIVGCPASMSGFGPTSTCATRA